MSINSDSGSDLGSDSGSEFGSDSIESLNVTIQSLLLNDSGFSVLTLNHLDDESVQECAAALRQNTSAKKLKLIDCSEEEDPPDEATDWVPFWNAISNHSVLEEICLRCADTLYSISFLDAIAESSSIKKVSLNELVVNVMSLSNFFRTTTSVTHFFLDCIKFESDCIFF
jgi:hypothetical protein